MQGFRRHLPGPCVPNERGGTLWGSLCGLEVLSSVLSVPTLTVVMARNPRSAEVRPEPVRRGPSFAEVNQAEMRRLSSLVAASGTFHPEGRTGGL